MTDTSNPDDTDPAGLASRLVAMHGPRAIDTARTFLGMAVRSRDETAMVRWVDTIAAVTQLLAQPLPSQADPLA
jgi:hypothetical protein